MKLNNKMINNKNKLMKIYQKVKLQLKKMLKTKMKKQMKINFKLKKMLITKKKINQMEFQMILMINLI